MPINYLHLQPQIEKYVADAQMRQEELRDKLAAALDLYHACGEDPEEKTARIRGHLLNQSPRPRSGIPSWERVDWRKDAPAEQMACHLLASDGSQIVPSAHEEISLGLINTSRISFTPQSGMPPQIEIESRFIEGEDGRIEMGELSEDLVSLQRDLAEIRILADWRPQEGLATIALGDGPLELFHQPRREAAFERIFQAYRDAMQQTIDKGMIPAGYTDKPRAGLVIKMLTLSAESKIDLSGLEDATLFNTLLQPGQRSAIFELFSPASDAYSGNTKLYFFYLQVGNESHPWSVRVEIPAGVAHDAEKVDLLHCALLDQCQLMGNRPYPYILHRAHEEAVIHLDEKQDLIGLLTATLQREGIPIPGRSYKQSAKDLKTRTRMGR